MTKVRVDFNRFVVACGLARENADKRELILLLDRIGNGHAPPITRQETQTLLNYFKPKRGRRGGTVTPKGAFMKDAVKLLLHAERTLKMEGYRDFRQEAERQVIKHLIAQGYSELAVKRLNLASARRRGTRKVFRD